MAIVLASDSANVDQSAKLMKSAEEMSFKIKYAPNL